MGIAPYKYFTYDGESSRTYDVYLTGEGVFNAPERTVEMIEIPGRNGNYALDQGRFNNIEVTYKAGIVDYSESDFADKVSAVRNWLCSKVGYKRLSDDYNPNEYRMAVYKSGVNIEHEDLRTGTFEITFDCKPQRWLTSGETATAVANNGTISNPTLFDASPALEFKGYGNIGISGQTINIANVPVGNILLANGTSKSQIMPDYTDRNVVEFIRQTINVSGLNTADTITLDTSTFTYHFTLLWPSDEVDNLSVFNQTGSGVNTVAVKQDKLNALFITTFDPIVFNKGTASTTTHTYQWSGEIGAEFVGMHMTVKIQYDGANAIVMSATEEEGGGNLYRTTEIGSLGAVNGYSTVTASGTFTVDLDLGEAYWDKSGTIIDANYAVSLGADLPTLKPGNNTITYDNTITNFKITPNWWKV